MIQSEPYIKIASWQIEEVALTKTQEEICQKLVNTALLFFRHKRTIKGPSPFRGFLLEGPPATGKTEIVRQCVRRIGSILGMSNVFLIFVDSGSIAAPKWGEAEARLKQIFADLNPNEWAIILFDDIDCLMMKRGSDVSKEWHYSIDSVMFHELDRLKPSNALVIGTTNRPDLIDDALRSRLYKKDVPLLPLNELLEIGIRMLRNMEVNEEKINNIISSLKERLKAIDKPTIRDVQHFVIEESISRGLI
jgi:SpoVK/Ycf46/Vps4 family AAA+-type ATPase